MKLLLDKMLTPDIARELRARGHDVVAVAGHPDWEGLSDSQIMMVARTEHRAIVTNNLRDYRPLHGEAITPGGHGHFGMSGGPPSGRMVARLITGQTPGIDPAPYAAQRFR